MVSSNAVRPLVPILIRLLGEHYRGEKTDTKIQQLLLPSGLFESVAQSVDRKLDSSYTGLRHFSVSTNMQLALIFTF